jgi:hypothetical protein
LHRGGAGGAPGAGGASGGGAEQRKSAISKEQEQPASGVEAHVDFTNFCMITYLPACSPTSSAHPLLSGPTGGLLQLSPPKDSSDAGIAAWLAEMRGWREQCTAQLGYMSGTVGPSQPDLECTATSYITVQSHPYRLRKQVSRGFLKMHKSQAQASHQFFS